MKIPLVYPKIPIDVPFPDKHCIAFEKLDGTNLHWVWDQDLGWYAFGTRRDRFDLDEQGITEFNKAHPGLEEAPTLFLKLFGSITGTSFEKELILFTEFYGPNSFAGQHCKDDPKQLVLFDAMSDGAMYNPWHFLDCFGHLPIPQILYRGKYSGQLIEDIHQGKYKVAEGAVIKGYSDDGVVRMIKVKTDAYLQNLKSSFKEDWRQYW